MSTSGLHQPMLIMKSRRKKTVENVMAKKEPMSRSRCSTSKMHKIIMNLKLDPQADAKREALHKAGFGSLLTINDCSVSANIQKWFYNHFDWISSQLELPNGTKITISKESVHRVYGIPIGGFTILEEESTKDDVKNFFNDLGLETSRFSHVPLRDLHSIIETDCTDILKYVRLFILIFIGSMVRPKANFGVDLSDYSFVLWDLNTMAHYDWCGHVYDYLLEAFAHRGAYFTGDVHLLQCAMLDNFVGATTELTTPTCAAWTSVRIKKIIPKMKFPAMDDQEGSLLSEEDQHDEEPLVKRMKRLRQKSKQAKINRLNELKRKKDEYVALIQSTNVKLNDTLLEISQIVAELEVTVHQSRQPRASNDAPQNRVPNCFSNENVGDHLMAEPEANGEKERVAEDADDRPAIVVDHVMAEPEENVEKERVAEDADDRLATLEDHVMAEPEANRRKERDAEDADVRLAIVEGDVMAENEENVDQRGVIEVADDVDDSLAIVVAEIPSFDIGIPVTQVTNPDGVDVPNAISRNSPRAKRKVNPGLALRSPYTVNCPHTIVDEVDEEMSAFIWSYKKKKRVLVVDDGDCQLDIHHLNDLCGRNWISSKYVEAFVNFLNFEHLDAIPIPGDNNIRKPSKFWLQPTILWQTVSSRRSTTTNVI